MYKIAFENPRICLECTVNVLVLVKVPGNFFIMEIFLSIFAI
jgi:hypothetical protein